jgi:ribosomal-protein-alanine N-acetyltransferase
MTMRRRGLRVYLRPPRATDATAFLAGVKASRRLHGDWVQPPVTPAGYDAFLRRFGGYEARDPLEITHAGLLVCRCTDDALVGVFNIGEIVRGHFESAYLWYYGFAPHAGAGYMAEGLELVLHIAFRVLKLHRIEANVPPTNRRSLALVRRAGFVREGYSRRYVRVAGRWCDHVRLTLLVEVCGFDEMSTDARERLARTLTAAVKATVGVTPRTELHAPLSLPRMTSGQGKTACHRVDDRRSC